MTSAPNKQTKEENKQMTEDKMGPLEGTIKQKMKDKL